MNKEIERINSAKLETLTFRDYIGLKSGRDSYSTVRYNELIKRFSAEDMLRISTSMPYDCEYQSVAMRWVLRGLQLDRAIKKAQTAKEIVTAGRAQYKMCMCPGQNQNGALPMEVTEFGSIIFPCINCNGKIPDDQIDWDDMPGWKDSKSTFLGNTTEQQ